MELFTLKMFFSEQKYIKRDAFQLKLGTFSTGHFARKNTLSSRKRSFLRKLGAFLTQNDTFLKKK